MVAFAADYAPTTEAPDAQNRAWGIFLAVEVRAGKNGLESRFPRREKAGLSYETASDPTNFLNRDPIGEQGGLNLYAFVGNDPVNRWDYLGKIAIAPILKGIDKQCTKQFINDILLKNLHNRIRANQVLSFLIGNAAYSTPSGDFQVIETDSISPIVTGNFNPNSGLSSLASCLRSFGKERLAGRIKTQYPDVPAKQIIDAAEEGVSRLLSSSENLSVDLRFFMFYRCTKCNESGNEGVSYFMNTRIQVLGGGNTLSTEWDLSTIYGSFEVPVRHKRYPAFKSVVCP